MYAMVANAPSEEEMSSAKVRIVWTMVHNTEINELLDIIGKCHASGDSVASFDPEFNRLSYLIKFGGVVGEPSQTRIAVYHHCRKRLLEFMSDGRRQLPPSL